ncbi:tRNA lysidine(34) synthetase TilS [Sphingomonas sp.]|uniref:tRNA lysidine(34) synthetase TilS n=1 Tax=Sphingomonas sp. TaxID=28214 RepID=UPI003AFFAD33
MPGRPLIDAAPIDLGVVARFRTDLERLTGEPPAPDRRLGLAVSGGGDSLALLLLATAAWPGAVAAATVDHGLRAEAGGEARFVARLCGDRGVPHDLLRPDARPPASGNIQDWARAARYRCLGRWAERRDIAFLATAHQRDDVAETFLMRAARGAGVRSLAAMPDTRALGDAAVLLVRPLLGWTRAALAGIVRAAGIEPVEDAANADPRFDRARIRRLLADPDLPAAGLARAATNLRDVEDAMEWLVWREANVRLVEDPDGVRLDAADLPFELQRRLALRAIEAVRQGAGLLDRWRVTAVPDLVRGLRSARGGTVADVQARALPGHWHFRLAPPRRPTEKA